MSNTISENDISYNGVGKLLIEPKANTTQTTTKGYNFLVYPYVTTSTTINEITFTDNGDGTITANGTATANTDFILSSFEFVSGKTYTITNGLTDNGYGAHTMLIPSYSIWGSNIYIGQENSTYATFTVSSTYALQPRITIYSGHTVNNLVFKPMIYEGEYDSSKNYEKYTNGASPNPDYTQEIKNVTGNNNVIVKRGNTTIATKQLNLGNNKLCKIGDYSDLIFKNEPSNPNYSSSLVENAWYIKNNIGFKKYTGSDSFQAGSASNTDYYIFQSYSNSNLTNKSTTENQIMSDTFINGGLITSTINPNAEQLNINTAARQCLRFVIKASRLSANTVAAFQTWLNSNNVGVYYILQTPTYTQITDTTLINQLEYIQRVILTGSTTIEIESDSNNAKLAINTKFEKYKIPKVKTLIPMDATIQDTNILFYKCAGSESGDYYFVYDSTNYQFTMPSISSGDILKFDTNTTKLSLNGTEITTATENTGTLITLSETPDPDCPSNIKNISGTSVIKFKSANKFLNPGYANECTNGVLITKLNEQYELNGTATANTTYTNTLSTPYTIQKGDYLYALNNVVNSSVSVILVSSPTNISVTLDSINKIYSLDSYVGSSITGVGISCSSGTSIPYLSIKPMITDLYDYRGVSYESAIPSFYKELELKSRNILDVTLPYNTNSSGTTEKAISKIPNMEVYSYYYVYGECSDGTILDGTNASLIFRDSSSDLLSVDFNSNFLNTLDISNATSVVIYTDSSLANKTISKIMLSKGYNKLPYRPYYDFTLKDLDFISDDYIIHSRKKTITLTGNETWNVNSNNQFYATEFNGDFKEADNSTSTVGHYSNYFKEVTKNDLDSGVEGFSVVSNKLCFYHSEYSSTGDLQGFKDWLSSKYSNGNPIVVEGIPYQIYDINFDLEGHVIHTEIGNKNIISDSPIRYQLEDVFNSSNNYNVKENLQELIDKFTEVKNEKDTKILPENIKEGITVYGVEGTMYINNLKILEQGLTTPFRANIVSFDLVDTSNVTNMNGMFEGCRSLTTVPLLDTSSVTNMTSMFYNCTNLVSIPLLNTSNVTNMFRMFEFCTSLTTVPLLDTSSATNIARMFYNCTSLTTVPLLNTSSATIIDYMFSYCPSLSNDSLNNILAMCTNSSVTSNKTLSKLGLTQTQATTCQSLSNYSAFTAAGWTTGY